MNILDLDDASTWEKIYNEFIRNDPYKSIIKSALSRDDKFNNIRMELEIPLNLSNRRKYYHYGNGALNILKESTPTLLLTTPAVPQT